MSAAAYSGVRMIWSRLRPVRLAIFVDENDQLWRDSCLSIIEWANQSWGGWYSLIVPTDGRRILDQFWFILERFDPDYVYPYGDTLYDRMRTSSPIVHELGARLNPFTLLPGRAEYVLQHPIHPLDGPPLLGADLVRVLPGVHPRRIMHIDLRMRYKDLKLYVYSQSGKLGVFKHHLEEVRRNCRQNVLFPPGVTTEQLQRLSASIYRHTFSEKDLYKVLHLIWKRRPFSFPTVRTTLDQGAYAHLPSSLSLINTSWTYQKQNVDRRAQQPVVLVVGDSVHDFCLYYDLSRMRDDTFWISERTIRKAGSGSDGHRVSGRLCRNYIRYLKDEVSDRLARRRSADQQVLVTSLSKSGQSLSKIVELFGEFTGVVTEEAQGSVVRISLDVRQMLASVDRLYEKGNYENSYLHEFKEGKDTELLMTPIPKSFRPIHRDHHWITEVEIEGYQLPAKRALTRRVFDYERLPSPFNQQVRISNDGICYWCPKMGLIEPPFEISPMRVLRPRLIIPSAFDVMQEIFGEAGYHLRYSSWGDYVRESIARFGSLDETVATLLENPFAQVFHKCLDHTENKSGVYDEGVFLDKKSPRLLDWETINKIVGDADRSAGFIDKLVTRAILKRGFLFQCQHCRNTAWYPVSEIDETFVCGLCGRRQTWRGSHWKRPVGEPHLYYRLDQIVFQALLHKMTPLLRCLERLKEDSTSFLFASGIEIRRDPSQGLPELEIDICSAVDGRLVLGEVTVMKVLAAARRQESDRIAKMAEVSVKIRPARFVFATLSAGWKARTESAIKDRFRGLPVPVEMWNRQDLQRG